MITGVTDAGRWTLYTHKQPATTTHHRWRCLNVIFVRVGLGALELPRAESSLGVQCSQWDFHAVLFTRATSHRASCKAASMRMLISARASDYGRDPFSTACHEGGTDPDLCTRG